MKELNRTGRLIIASILFVLIILVGLLTFRNPAFEYKISIAEMIDELYNPNNKITPEQAMKLIDNGLSSFVFVDLRNPYQYNRGFIGEAINIPVSDIFDDENFSLFQQMQIDSIVVVLYSNNQREANSQWMLLKQLGFNNVKVLLGGYDYFDSKKNNPSDLHLIHSYQVEEPALDYAAYFEDIDNGSDKPKENHADKPIMVQPVKKIKKNASAGGC